MSSRISLFLFLLLGVSAHAAQAAEKTAAELAAAVRPALVKISQFGREGLDGIGSGFVIRADGLVATNFHVIDVGRRIQVEMQDGKKYAVKSIHATDPDRDLALLQIDAKGLPVLPLGDVESARQGDTVVAMGAPEGLSWSIVQGILSAKRDDLEGFEGRMLLQVAMPVERGNSGGPLLDAQGRVLGVISMKHARKENLGFAIPVDELQHLIEKPNPVLMSRWLTIGALNAKQWKTHLGAEWSQRAGVIHVTEPGEGFGGRALCISTQKVPEGTFETAVNVQLDDEGGAAGLLFCSDGADRHYGFYPSDGKLRLTRFDGPDVYSWTILANPESEHYHPGDWNHLRVRVEPERITCYVNGQAVIEIDDTGLRGGAVGLCKFRQTEADFRNFRVGSDLAEKALDPALAKKFDQQLQNYLSEEEGTDTTLEGLLDQPAAARRLILEKRRELEQETASLRQLERELHRRAVTRDLVQELAKPEPEVNLMRCALLLARHDNAEIDVGAYLAQFRAMVADLKNDPEIRQGTPQAVKRLTRFLFEENGFHGSRGDYESLSNSYMNEVLDDREGLPITLSVLFVEMARELGIQGVFGVPLPGKFMVGWRDGPEGELHLVDVFEGGRSSSVIQITAQLQKDEYLPPDVALPDELLAPATKRSIIQRMLNNLRNHHMGDGDPRESLIHALPYIRLLIALAPEEEDAEVMDLMQSMGVTSREELLRKIDEMMRHKTSGTAKSRGSPVHK
ncbi:MAG: trypsin-like peptidase domain-containing protein [Verrucomicrobiaceae bacterium]|nr:trypsin-like peptidase domain-containing protein [Verrucomicrobiaceae bacterium]